MNQVDSLLALDLILLKLGTRSSYVENFGNASWRQLFIEGIHCSYDFFREEITPLAKRFHPRRSLRLLEKTCRRVQKLHPISAGSVFKNPYRACRKLINSNQYTFNTFEGMWHGKWREDRVDHLWLPTNSDFDVDSTLHLPPDCKLLAFQSVCVGDGIGWNYLIQHRKRIILLGYVCHFNKSGDISQRRPHFGFPQPGKGVTWFTKDHIYQEFVCKSPSCDIKDDHYVITGFHFARKLIRIELINAFQAVYFSKESSSLPYWQSIPLNP